MRKKGVDMLHGPVLRPLLAFSVPMVLTSWLQILFNSADSFVVGRWAGSGALAAVGSTFVFVMLVISFFGGLSAGITVCASTYMGAGDKEGFDKTAHTSMVMSLIVGFIVLIIGEVFARPVLVAMKSPADVIDDAMLYIRIYFLCMPAQLVYSAGASILRSRGDSKRPLLFLTVSGAANLGLNMLFVIVFKLSVVGVASATLITQYLSAVLVTVYLFRMEGEWRLEVKKLRMHKDKVLKILRIGVPAGLQAAMLAASDIPLQTAVNSLGSLAVSGNSAAMNIDGAIFVTMDSLCQGCNVFTAQNVGARQHDRVKKILFSSMLVTVLSGLIIGWAGFALRYQIIGLFLPDSPAAVAHGAARCMAVSTMTFIYGFLVTLNASMRGYGISYVPAIVNIVGLCGFRFAWAHFYFPKHPTLFHLYISYPAAWTLCVIATAILYKPLIKRARLKTERLEAG